MQKITILIISISLFSLACVSSAAMLNKASPSPIPLPTIPAPGLTACIVTADEALNVRDKPGTSSSVIAWLKAGDYVTILSAPTASVWIQIKTQGGLEGWINSKFCEVKND